MSERTPSKTPEERVEEFIKRIHDKDLEITAEARNIYFYVSPDNRIMKALGSKQGRTKLVDKLAWAMLAYDSTKKDPLLNQTYTIECLEWINRAYTWNAIKEGKGLVRKFKQAQEKIKKLEQDNADLSKQLLILKGKYDELAGVDNAEEMEGTEFYDRHIRKKT